jgi:hypothetical protein
MDLSEFQENATPWRICSVTYAIEALTDEQRATLQEAFLSRSITSSKIAEVLTRWSGRRITAAAARRHRRKECKCND